MLKNGNTSSSNNNGVFAISSISLLLYIFLIVVVVVLPPPASGMILGGQQQSSSSSTPKIDRVSAGTSGLEISSMGCGTWSWGNRLLFNYNPNQDEDIYEAYREIRNAGVTIFDTADSYGTLDLNGRAEILLGQFERRYQQELIKSTTTTNNNNNNINWFQQLLIPKQQTSDDNDYYLNQSNNNVQQVATKLAPYPWRITSNQVVNAAKASLKRLQQDKLTIAQLHWSTSNYQPLQERALWDGICQVYEQGLCDAIGVSNYGPQQLLKANEQVFQPRNVPLAIAQVQYSLLTYSNPLTQEMTNVCNTNNNNIRLISYSPLCLGLLTGKYNIDNLPPIGNPRRELFKELLPSAQNLLQTLEVVAKEYNKSQTQVAINWTMCKGTVPIPGARTVKQAKENLGATGWSLKSDAIEMLDVAAKNVKKPMIQNVFQTK